MSLDLRNEGDVKDYLEKLGIEYRFGCYSEKRPEVCHLLGDYLESIKKDFEKASKVYRSNCDDYGYSRSCFKYGNYTFLGKGRTGQDGSPAEAFQYYQKGCELKDADSCLHAGLMLVSRQMQDKVKQDVNLGIDYLQRSCGMNNATACFYLSGLHISGVERNIPSKLPEAETEKSSSTKKTLTSSSSKLSSPPAANPTTSFVIEKDMKKAFDFAYKACELRNMYACANLSQMYARGEGTEKNKDSADKYRKMALEMQEELKKPQAQLEFQQGLKS